MRFTCFSVVPSHSPSCARARTRALPKAQARTSMRVRSARVTAKCIFKTRTPAAAHIRERMTFRACVL
eukprot:3857998-Pleurochrysis_carterae.AAC.2